MTQYYTYKSTADVIALPGQTVQFTTGKGYYITGTPTSTSSSTNQDTIGGLTYSEAVQVAKTIKPASTTPTGATHANTQPTAATTYSGGTTTTSTTPRSPLQDQSQQQAGDFPTNSTYASASPKSTSTATRTGSTTAHTGSTKPPSAILIQTVQTLSQDLYADAERTLDRQRERQLQSATSVAAKATPPLLQTTISSTKATKTKPVTQGNPAGIQEAAGVVQYGSRSGLIRNGVRQPARSKAKPGSSFEGYGSTYTVARRGTAALSTAFSQGNLALSISKVEAAGGWTHFKAQAETRDAWRKTVAPIGREFGRDSSEALEAHMQFVADRAAKNPGSVDDILNAFRETSGLERIGKALPVGNVILGVATLALDPNVRTTSDKINVGVTVLGIGGGIVETAMLVGFAVPGVGEVLATAIGVGVSVYAAYELSQQIAGFVGEHEAAIRAGFKDAENAVKSASGFLQSHPEIDPAAAIVSALVSNRGNILAAGKELGDAVARDGASILEAGRGTYSMALSLGSSVLSEGEHVGADAVHVGEHVLHDIGSAIGSIL